MTIQSLKKKKQELLASQVSNLVSDTNENLLRINLSKFFTDLETQIQKALLEYWNDTLLLQGQINLILSPIHETHQQYFELLMKHKLQEFKRGKRTGERLVKRQTETALKSAKPVKFKHSPNELFGTLQYTEDKLSNDTFTASEHTLNRVDDNINQILTDGYREGKGINDVSRRITERFDQLRTWEATRIARTEIHTAQNMGMMSSYESLGVEYTQWKAAHDKRTRISHRDIDGEIIPFGGMYSNKLKFPGDKSGKIEEWINCRCSNAPYVMPAGMMAPPGMSNFKESDLIPIGTQPVQPTEPQPIETAPQLSNETPIRGKNSDIKLKVNTEEVKRKISSHIEEIADTPQEYKELMKSIPDFRKRTINKKTEEMWIMDNNLNTYHQKKGSSNRVQMPEEAQEIAKKEGLLISGHNHPYGTAVQSETDLTTLGTARQKYSWTTGDDGIFMIKNNRLDLISPETNINYVQTRDKIRLIYKREMKKWDKQFEKDMSSQLDELQKRYLSREITRKQYANEYNDVYKNYISRNANQIADNCNQKYSKEGLGVEMRFIPL